MKIYHKIKIHKGYVRDPFMKSEKWIYRRATTDYFKSNYNLTPSQVWNICNGYDKDELHYCKYCGKLLTYKNLGKGFGNSCSLRCSVRLAYKDPSFKEFNRKHLTALARSPEGRLRARKHAMSLFIINTQSSLELDIISYLSAYFPVQSKYYIPGSDYLHPYDLYVKLPNCDLLIEVDGDYWHSGKNPKWDYNKDKDREINALKYGYKFLIIRESDYINNRYIAYVKSLISGIYPPFKDMHKFMKS